MKIIWLAHRDPRNPKPGGAERTIYEICTRLVAKGNDVTLLSGGWKNSAGSDDIKGVKVLRLGRNVAPHLALPIILLKNHYDIIIDDLGHAVPWVISTFFKKNNIAFFHHLHARSLPGQVNILLAKLITSLEKVYFIIYHKAIFVTESTTSKNDLLNLGIDQNKIVTIPPGVDNMLFHPSNKTDFPSIVYFGGLRRYKRPEECIYMLKNLLVYRKDIKLYIVGSGPECKNIKTLSKKLHLENNVEFTGRISNEKLAKIVASSWLNVHTSITEGWGFSILEASSAGTPSVAYSVPGVVDAIEINLNGILVKNGDNKALANAALKIISDPERWWRTSTEVSNKYSWDITTNLWEDLLSKIAY